MLVHDGARPLVSPALVDAVVAAAADGTVPRSRSLPVAETLKRVADGQVVDDRRPRRVWPRRRRPRASGARCSAQAFGRFPADGPATWTDEAALLEACTIPVHAIPGDPRNLKVTCPTTSPASTRAAAAVVPCSPASGSATTATRSGRARRCALGGIDDRRGAARSTATPTATSRSTRVADALLGAAGLGDLGRLFPAGPATPRGIDSRELLAEVVAPTRRRRLRAGRRST